MSLQTRAPLIRGFFAIIALTLAACNEQKTDAQIMKEEITQDLTGNLLPFWMEKTVDPAGGFYGTVYIDGKADANADKGAVLNARILWTFSKAYNVFHDPQYKELADRAAAYVKQYFIDPDYGGMFWSLDKDGKVSDSQKQSYASAFAIYGLAEHFSATADRSSLDAAIGLFRTLEDKVHDKVHGGYDDAFVRDYSSELATGVDGFDNTPKTMNTHIHILEAYTTLYKVWPEPELRQSIMELLGILQTHLYNADTEHLILFCDDEWNPLPGADSYGHDVETSWLMVEAAQTVCTTEADAQLLESVRTQAVRMVDKSLAEALTPEGYLIYERGGVGQHEDISWWPQCETVNGCVNAWQITGDSKYLDIAAKVWNYIKTHFIDSVDGGWFMSLNADGTPVMTDPKASLWNCPYHNSRMGFEVISRLNQ